MSEVVLWFLVASSVPRPAVVMQLHTPGTFVSRALVLASYALCQPPFETEADGRKTKHSGSEKR